MLDGALVALVALGVPVALATRGAAGTVDVALGASTVTDLGAGSFAHATTTIPRSARRRISKNLFDPVPFGARRNVD